MADYGHISTYLASNITSFAWLHYEKINLAKNQ